MATSQNNEFLNDDCLAIIIDHLANILRQYPWAYGPHRRGRRGRKDLSHLKSFSCVSPRIRELCIPTLFGNSGMVIRISGYEQKLDNQLTTIIDCSFIANRLHALSISQTPYRPTLLELANDKSGLLNKVLAILAKAKDLRELSLHGLTYDREQDALKQLNTGTFNNFRVSQMSRINVANKVLSVLPSLEVVSLPYPGWYRSRRRPVAFPILARSKNVISVELYNDSWTVTKISKASRYLANVKKLVLHGEILAKITDMAPAFEGLPVLQHLDMTQIVWVDVNSIIDDYTDDDSRAWHGYDEYMVDAIATARDDSPFNEDKDVVARALFTANGSLQNLRLTSATTFDDCHVEREGDGTVKELQWAPRNERPGRTARSSKLYKSTETKFDLWGSFT